MRPSRPNHEIDPRRRYRLGKHRKVTIRVDLQIDLSTNREGQKYAGLFQERGGFAKRRILEVQRFAGLKRPHHFAEKAVCTDGVMSASHTESADSCWDFGEAQRSLANPKRSSVVACNALCLMLRLKPRGAVPVGYCALVGSFSRTEFSAYNVQPRQPVAQAWQVTRATGYIHPQGQDR